MLHKIFVSNCIGLENFDLSLDSTHSVINKDKVTVVKILKNIYNGSNNNDILNNEENSVIELHFVLNNDQIDYISSYLVLDSNYLVVSKAIEADKTIYYINEKQVNFTVIKKILNFLIDNRRIVTSLYGDPLTVLDNYILKHDEDYSLNKYNYLKLNSLRKEYENELNIINDNKSEESIMDIVNIKNEIESFDLEKGEIEYITKMYNSLNEENTNKNNYDKVLESFNNALLLMKDSMLELESLEKEDNIASEVSELEASFYNMKEKFDALKNKDFDNKDQNSEYIIERYNNIQKFKEKYGNTYKEINEYYQSIVSKINYYKYSKVNLKNIEEKISTIDTRMNEIMDNIVAIRKDYTINILNYFNQLCEKFDEDITLNASFDEENKGNISLYLNINSKLVTLEELKEYDNYNLITFLLNTIFLVDYDKTIIVDDDFSDEFDSEKMFIYIKLLNQFSNCLVLSNNEQLG